MKHCDITVEHCDTKLEHSDTIVEYCERRVEHCYITVEHSDSQWSNVTPYSSTVIVQLSTVTP